jgi:hypothetical protein
MDQDQNVELRDEQEVAEAKGHDMKNAEAQSVAQLWIKQQMATGQGTCSSRRCQAATPRPNAKD